MAAHAARDPGLFINLYDACITQNSGSCRKWQYHIQGIRADHTKDEPLQEPIGCWSRPGPRQYTAYVDAPAAGALISAPAAPLEPGRREDLIRLTSYTNYCIRVLMYCAVHPHATVTIADIAGAYGISRAHLLKAARQLGHLGYLQTLRGRGGGIRLALPPGEICIGEVVRTLEDTSEFVECFNPETNTCPIAGPCRLTGLLRRGVEAFYREFDGVTLADLVGTGDALRVRLVLSPSA